MHLRSDVFAAGWRASPGAGSRSDINIAAEQLDFYQQMFVENRGEKYRVRINEGWQKEYKVKNIGGGAGENMWKGV